MGSARWGGPWAAHGGAMHAGAGRISKPGGQSVPVVARTDDRQNREKKTAPALVVTFTSR